ncbi:DUF2635 domain-containing protein [Xanthobacter oligotrophicus]|uniref:DUF2635 domain-containing protein n=1 Tax=Xanthobacter oligotrophicus TaxID=2607286 RepID=A0ABW6ZS68_9HYPH
MPRLRPTLVDLGEGPVRRVLKDPRDQRPLPEDGRDVPLSPFWIRRLRDGDVEVMPANDPASTEPAQEPASEPAAGGEPEPIAEPIPASDS